MPCLSLHQYIIPRPPALLRALQQSSSLSNLHRSHPSQLLLSPLLALISIAHGDEGTSTNEYKCRENRSDDDTGCTNFILKFHADRNAVT